MLDKFRWQASAGLEAIGGEPGTVQGGGRMNHPMWGVRIGRGIVTYWNDTPLTSLELAEQAQQAILEHTGETGEIEEVLLVVGIPEARATEREDEHGGGMSRDRWFAALRCTAEAQQHSSGDAHGVSVKPSQLLTLIECVWALDAIVNPEDPHTDGYGELEAAHKALEAVLGGSA